MPRMDNSKPYADIVDEYDSADDDAPVANHHAESKLEEDVDAKEQLKEELNDQIERTSGKRARKAEEKTVVDETSANGDEEDNDEEKAENEFDVDHIVAHKHNRGKVLYRVRWVGWDESDDTWEPEENLLPESRTALANYHHKVGGNPASTSMKRSKSKSSMKPDPEAESTPPASKRQKRASTMKKEEPETTAGVWLPNKNMSTWEDLVQEIETVERDAESDELRAFIIFKNGKKTKVSRNLYFQKCPRAMLMFYEKHLSV